MELWKNSRMLGQSERTLTQPILIEEGLMKNDFEPIVDHHFSLRADWDAVNRPEVSKVLSPGLSHRRARGPHLRMEQSGFRTDQEQAYQSAKGGRGSFQTWNRSWPG